MLCCWLCVNPDYHHLLISWLCFRLLILTVTPCRRKPEIISLFPVFSVFAVKRGQLGYHSLLLLPPLSVVQQFGDWIRGCIFIRIVYISLKQSDEHSAKWGWWNVWGGVGWDGCCYHAHSLDAKIIQHELLMPWIIARFHGYSPAECGPLSDSSGEIKTLEKMEKFPLQRCFFFFFLLPQHMYLHL